MKRDRAAREARLVEAFGNVAPAMRAGGAAEGREGEPIGDELDHWLSCSVLPHVSFDRPELVRDLAAVLAKHASDEELERMTARAQWRARICDPAEGEAEFERLVAAGAKSAASREVA